MARRTRRSFLDILCSAVIVGIAGCSDSNDTTTPPQDTPSSQAPGTDTQTVTNTPEETETRTPLPDFVRPNPPDVPDLSHLPEITSTDAQTDADWVVAKDGSGDYNTVLDAMRAAEQGDTIFLDGTEFTIEQEHDYETYTFIGRGAADTTIELVFEQKRDFPAGIKAAAVTKRGEYAKFPQLNSGTVVDADIRFGIYGRQEATGTIQNSRIRGGIDYHNSAQSESGKIEITDSVIQGVVLGAADLTRTVVEDTCVLRRNSSIVDSIIEDKVTLKQLDNFEVENSRLNGIRFAWGHSGSEVTIRRCEINRIPNQTTAVRIGDSDAYIEGCHIHGACVIGERRGAPHAETIIGNVFESSGVVDWYLDGIGAFQTTGNVFTDGDIRIDSNGTDFNSDGLGNYYAAFDGDDSDENGIIDTPRPIPGNGEKVDRNPLAEAKPAFRKY